MALSTYGELKAGVLARSFRSDLTSLVEDFIRRAHNDIVGRVAVASDLSVSSEATALPSDFRKVVSVWLKTAPMTPLVLADESQMTGGSSWPAYYRVDGTDLVVSPAPTSTFTAALHYRLTRTFFASDGATNTVLTRHPFLYLHGAMAELFRHVRNADEAARYEGLYEAELQRVNAAEQSDLLDGQLQMTSASVNP